MTHRRHGDLLFSPVNKLPEGLTAQNNNGAFILALGEHTNHKHVITKQEGTLDIFKDKNGSIFLVVDGKSVLTHEEHKPIEFTTGTYKMTHEREYDYFLDEVTRVQD